MATGTVNRVEIIAYSGKKEELLSLLQKNGFVQIEKTTEEILKAPLPVDVSDSEELINRLTKAIDFLERWDEEKWTSRLFSPPLQASWNEKEELLNQELVSLLQEVEKLQEEEKEILSRIIFLEKELEFLLPLTEFPLPIKEVKPTEKAEVILGNLPASSLVEMTEIEETEEFWFDVFRKEKRTVSLLVVFHREKKDLIEQKLKENGFNPLYFTGPILSLADDEDFVPQIIEKIEEKVESERRLLENLSFRGKDLFPQREKFMKAHDFLLSEAEKARALLQIGFTDQAFLLEGWLKESDVPRFRQVLKPLEDWTEVTIRKPEPDEEPPVVLDNPSTVQPFELITRLYGLPRPGSLDPTLPLTPFFFVFVGLAVSEAGYGLLVTLLSLIFLRWGKPKGGLFQFTKLMVFLGISNIILGTLVGGWFGFQVRGLLVLDPLKDPLSFLILALALGFIQVWYGTLLQMKEDFREKKILRAVFVQGGWLLLLPSLVLYLTEGSIIWGWFSFSGALGIVLFSSSSRNVFSRFFGGLYSLYDISRYLADVLSYSRLLALGLATSVIAMVVNTLSESALGVPWLGWFLAAVVFVIGHLFNLGISFLGGFVHSMRLQFVEFFSKFFKSGGRPFKPFALTGKYVEFR
ncbi:MAG: V-type ATP synthase subunit I [Acidobacteriota bacterium]